MTFLLRVGEWVHRHREVFEDLAVGLVGLWAFGLAVWYWVSL